LGSCGVDVSQGTGLETTLADGCPKLTLVDAFVIHESNGFQWFSNMSLVLLFGLVTTFVVHLLYGKVLPEVDKYRIDVGL